ncbi:MAG TPA: hypothetical protein VGR87_15290 [Candidatus Limnocylindria bacterium]|nr:hypothetical protein [Candidatus Limnocylindria bacterium]
MNRTQAAYVRLFLICAAYALGVVVAQQLDASAIGMWVGAALGAAAYVFTQDLDRPRRGGGGRGEIRYWRGRRVDDDDGPRRWN